MKRKKQIEIWFPFHCLDGFLKEKRNIISLKKKDEKGILFS